MMFWLVSILCIFVDISFQQTANVTTESPGFIDTTLNNISINQLGWFSIKESDVEFRLITRKTCIYYQILKIGKLINDTVINPKATFKFIIHGFQSGPDADWFKNMTAAFVQKADYNVVQVDWSKPAKSVYPIAARYTKSVAFFTAKLIADLNKNLSVPLNNIHLIGHSLGAHIAGYTGKFVKQLLGQRIARISGLDPAGPLFLLATSNDRLDSTDADFVDVIHTDGGKYGYFGALGTADFYPQGGVQFQPACSGLKFITDMVGCSHNMAHEYYTESIHSRDFVARECSSYISYLLRRCEKAKSAIMGENINLNTTGIYYLTVNSQSPYARNGTI